MCASDFSFTHFSDQGLTFESVYSECLKLGERDVFERRLPIELQWMCIQLCLTAGIKLLSPAGKLHSAWWWGEKGSVNATLDLSEHGGTFGANTASINSSFITEVNTLASYSAYKCLMTTSFVQTPDVELMNNTKRRAEKRKNTLKSIK